MEKNVTPEILKTFIHKTSSGNFAVIDPVSLDDVIGIFEEQETAEKAFMDFVESQQIIFE